MLAESIRHSEAGLGAEHAGFLHYLYISTESRPFTLPQVMAVRLRDTVVEYHQEHGTGNAYRIERLMECGNAVAAGAAHWKYQCNLPECPLCYRRRAYRKAAEAACMDSVLRESDFTTQMITIALPDVEAEAMPLRYAALSAGCSKLLKGKAYRRRVAGTARCIETSVADTGGYHVHVHLLVAFPDVVLSDAVLNAVQHCFPQGIVYASPPVHGVHLARFAGYVLKLPDDVEAAEWLNIRTMMQGKSPLTFSGIFREARRTNKHHSPKRLLQ